MAYLVLDTFLDKSAAEEKADAYRKAGRDNVEVMAVNGITVNDCSCFPCEAKFVQDGSPLYVLITQG